MLQKSATEHACGKMPKFSPYLQRRGDTFSFRIAVPAKLHGVVGGREYTKTLGTTDKYIAIPLALEFAASAKRLFGTLMGMNEEEQKRLMRDAKHKVQLNELREQHDRDLFEQRLQSRKSTEVAVLKAENEILKGLVTNPSVFGAANRLVPAGTPSAPPEAAPVPMFSIVINNFLDKYPRVKNPAMFGKHQPVLMMLLDVIGDKPVNELRQADVNGFFALLEKLPPRWKDECRKLKISIRQLAETDHPVTLGPKSFDDTYKACVRAFLKVAKKDWQDQGFPTTITTDGIEYQGDREEGENKQRAFKAAELQRLFEGAEMKGFAADSAQSHCYWLPHIGLFTGARVNEICQLNPQADILQDSESGIWHFWITEETEGDDRIEKSTKNKESRRKVPIHSKLLELGILAYVEIVKVKGAKLLFPAWKPSRGKASGEGEKWFRQLIRNIGLRDETPFAKVVGMHAFRHTLLNRASNTNPPIDATSITGHAGEKSSIVRGYEGELSLENKRKIVEAIRFELSFIKPQTMAS